MREQDWSREYVALCAVQLPGKAGSSAESTETPRTVPEAARAEQDADDAEVEREGEDELRLAWNRYRYDKQSEVTTLKARLGYDGRSGRRSVLPHLMRAIARALGLGSGES